MNLEESLQQIEDVEREHEELRQLIGTIQKNFSDPSRPFAVIQEQLATLSKKLQEHFHTEEQGGFFAQIMEQAPRLSTQADKLCDEHHALQRALDAITQQAGQPASSPWCELQQAFHDFSKRLMHHESEENEMLQQAYWEDIGPAD